jgi:hypothetical protein
MHPSTPPPVCRSGSPTIASNCLLYPPPPPIHRIWLQRSSSCSGG